MNYYSANNGWNYMWQNWDHNQIDADFARIKGLNMNAVRVILHVNVFTVPTPPAAELTKLSEMIILANKHNLKVQLTLFDFFGSYTNIDGSKKWVDAVVAPYQNDSRIAYIDVQNEIDTQNADVMNWISTMVPYIKSKAGTIPVTVSVTERNGRLLRDHAGAIYNAKIPVDFYDLHYYGRATSAYAVIKDIRDNVLAGAPMIIGETGYSSYTGQSGISNVNLNSSSTEAVQDQFHRTVQYALQQLNLPKAAPWAYSDFGATSIPMNLKVGSDQRQYHYGVFRTDYSEKRAAQSLRSYFGGAALDTSVNNSFELVDSSGLPLYWRLWKNPTSGYDATFAYSEEQARTGKSSGKITNSTDSNDKPAFYLSPVINTVPGVNYTATVYAKGVNATGSNRITIAWFDVNGSYINNCASTTLPAGNSDWTLLSVSCVAPANAAYPEIHLQSSGNTGAVYFDDMNFSTK
jgi:hypothetical protein